MICFQITSIGFYTTTILHVGDILCIQCCCLLLQSAKQDPYNCETFLYLGHFSLDFQQDQTRAKKCFQKAFDLDTSCDEAGAALCDLLTSSDQEEEAHTLLLSVTSKASAGWQEFCLYFDRRIRNIINQVNEQIRGSHDSVHWCPTRSNSLSL